MMRAPQASNTAKERQLATERRLQTGAALGLGIVVLVVIALRAGVHNVFAQGWWRH